MSSDLCSSVVDCSPCSQPCDSHAVYPDSLIAKIDYTSSMADSVKSHRRHIVVLQSTQSSKWPVEVSDYGYIQHVAQQLSGISREIGYSVRLTAGESEAGVIGPSGRLLEPDELEEFADILLFPDQIKFLHVRRSEVESLLKFILIEERSGASAKDRAAMSSIPSPANAAAEENFLSGCPVPHVRLPGHWFLICAHKLRDNRCGIAGPILYNEFQKYVQEEGLNDIHTLKISHVGGHKFAACVIAYPSGVWFGRVLPCHVETLIRAYARGDQTERNKVQPLVRGKIDLELNW